MTGVNPALGYDTGTGRMFGSGDGSKVVQQPINEKFNVDDMTIRRQEQTFAKGIKTLTNLPAGGDFRCLEDEIAFKLRGKADQILTTLNGLEAPFMQAYSDPEMVRQCLRFIIQPLGVIHRDTRTDLKEAPVTVQMGGSAPQYAPGKYNVPGTENAHISSGVRVVADLPKLDDPVMAGPGRASGKVGLILRAATKDAMPARVLRWISHIVHDPNNFKAVMKPYNGVCNSELNAAFAIAHSYTTSNLMFLDVLLAEGIVKLGDGNFGLNAPLPDGQPPTSTEIVARIAEGISVFEQGEYSYMDQGRFAASLTAEQSTKWNNVANALRHRQFPLPDPVTGKYNSAYEYGLGVDPENGVFSSVRSLSNGEPLRSPGGQLLQKSLTHMHEALAAYAVAVDEEQRFTFGVAMSTPNQHGTAQFSVNINLQGGMSWGPAM